MSEIRNEIISGKQSGGGLSNNVDTYLNFTALQTALPTPIVGMLAFVQDTKSTYVCYTAGIWTEQGGGSSGLVEHTYSFANQTNFIITHNLGRRPSIVRVLDLDYIDINKVQSNRLAYIRDGSAKLPVNSSIPWISYSVSIDTDTSNGFIGNNHAVFRTDNIDSNTKYYFEKDSRLGLISNIRSEEHTSELQSH